MWRLSELKLHTLFRLEMLGEAVALNGVIQWRRCDMSSLSRVIWRDVAKCASGLVALN